MKCYLELWNAKEAWTNLSKEDRANYLGQLGPHIESLVNNGVEIVNWGTNDSSTANRAAYDFFAIWKFPTQQSVSDFEALVEGAGWYDYFEQVNVSGEATSPEEVLGKLIDL